MASLPEIQKLLEDILSELSGIGQKIQITPEQVVIVNGLSDLSERLGLVRAGEFRAGNDKEPGKGFTGVRIGYPPFSYSNDVWNIAGVNNDLLQFGLNAADGKAYFAGGQAILDVSGAIFQAQNSKAYYIFWKTDDDQTTVGKIGAFYVGLDSGIEIVGQPKTGSYTPVAHLLTANASGTFLAGIEIRGSGEFQFDMRTGLLDGANQQKIKVMSNISPTNTISAMMQFELNSKGTPAAGFGVDIPIFAENNAGVLKQIGGLRARYTDTTNGSEDSIVEVLYIVGGVVTAKQIAP